MTDASTRPTEPSPYPIRVLLRILGRHSTALALMAVIGLVVALAISSIRDQQHTATSIVQLNPVYFQLGPWQDSKTSLRMPSAGRAIREITSHDTVTFALLSLLSEDAVQTVFADVTMLENAPGALSWQGNRVAVLGASGSAHLNLQVTMDQGVPSVKGATTWKWDATTNSLEAQGWRIQLSEAVMNAASFELEVVPLPLAVERARKELQARSAGSPELLEVSFTDNSQSRAVAILDAILASYAGSNRRQLETVVQEIDASITKEQARVEAEYSSLAGDRGQILANAGVGLAETSLEAASLRLSALDALIADSNLRLLRLTSAVPTQEAELANAESLLDWELDLPSAIPVIEQLAVAITEANLEGAENLRAILLEMAQQARNREQAHLDGLGVARQAMTTRIQELLATQDQAIPMTASLEGSASVLTDLSSHQQHMWSTLNTLNPSMMLVESAKVPVQVRRLEPLAVALLGCLGGLLLGFALVAFLESRRQGIWTELQAAELMDLPCISGPTSGLTAWMEGVVLEQPNASTTTCLLFAWNAHGGRSHSRMKRAADALLAAKQHPESSFQPCLDPFGLPQISGSTGNHPAFLVLKSGESDLVTARRCMRLLDAGGWNLCGAIILP